MIKEAMSRIEPQSYVDISGGEPGLVAPEIIDWVMGRLVELNCKIELNTNGIFLRRYPQYYSVIHSFLYHCSEYLDIKKDIYIPQDPEGKIDYMVTVDDERLPLLEPFLDKYPDIMFGVFGADRPYSSLDNRTSLSKINCLKTLNKFKSRINPEYYKYLYSTCAEQNDFITLYSL
jgi:organic radical activating enzyme